MTVYTINYFRTSNRQLTGRHTTCNIRVYKDDEGKYYVNQESNHYCDCEHCEIEMCSYKSVYLTEAQVNSYLNQQAKARDYVQRCKELQREQERREYERLKSKFEE